MLKHRPLLIAIVGLASCTAGHAQGTDITVDTKATPQDIQAWLSSGDPRLVAWGAYFARVNADDHATATMVQLMESWTAPGKDEEQASKEDINAMSDVLDALIVRKRKVSLEALSAIASSFPNQAAILASRLPIAEATPLLLTWYEKRNSDDHSVLPRIAAMLLSNAPPPGFAASVLAESEEDLRIIVLSANYGVGYGGSIGSSCGDGWGVAPPAGWPAVFRYGVEENSPHSHDPVLIRAAGDTITYHRIDTNTGWGSCFDPRPLTMQTRMGLVVQMLGGDTKKIPWAIERQSSIAFENNAQFLRELQEQINKEEADMQATAEDLFARGFLTRAEADLVRPKLAVTVSDNRIAGGLPLPRMEARDPRTTLNFQTR
jgi:hypothetical protein